MDQFTRNSNTRVKMLGFHCLDFILYLSVNYFGSLILTFYYSSDLNMGKVKHGFDLLGLTGEHQNQHLQLGKDSQAELQTQTFPYQTA